MSAEKKQAKKFQTLSKNCSPEISREKPKKNLCYVDAELSALFGNSAVDDTKSVEEEMGEKMYVQSFCPTLIERKRHQKKTGDAEKFTLNGSDSSEKAVSPYANEHLAEKYTILAPVAINCHKKN